MDIETLPEKPPAVATPIRRRKKRGRQPRVYLPKIVGGRALDLAFRNPQLRLRTLQPGLHAVGPREGISVCDAMAWHVDGNTDWLVLDLPAMWLEGSTVYWEEDGELGWANHPDGRRDYYPDSVRSQMCSILARAELRERGLLGEARHAS